MNLSNENKLLLSCAQTEIVKDKMEQIKGLLSHHLNWEEVLDSAFSHGIAPLLYYNLKNIRKSQFIPQEVMDKLEKAYHGNVARNMYLYVELNRILEAFYEKAVEVILLKGAALAKTVYADIGLRTMGDIDLLVKQQDLLYIKKIMYDLKYVPYQNSKTEEWHIENHFHLPKYIYQDKLIIVEIHWNILRNSLRRNSFPINIDEWWERTKVSKIGNCHALIPSPEDMLLHLCLHLMNHGYNKITLRGLFDILETVRYYKNEIDWQLFKDKINRCKIHKPVYTIMFLVKKLQIDTNKSLSWVKPDFVDLKLVTLIEKRITNRDSVYAAIPKQLVRSIVVDNFWKKARILLNIIFPAREEMAKWYSLPMLSKKIYFYYFIRPFKLFLKYRKSLHEFFRYLS